MSDSICFFKTKKSLINNFILNGSLPNYRKRIHQVKNRVNSSNKSYNKIRKLSQNCSKKERIIEDKLNDIEKSNRILLEKLTHIFSKSSKHCQIIQQMETLKYTQ